MVRPTDQNLASMGIHLPPPVTPFGPYVPAVQTGRLLFLSGMLPTVGHEPRFVGRVGRDQNVEQGRSACRAAALNVLAVAKAHLGSLERISRMVKLGVYIAATEKPADLVSIADGASELLRDVFGVENLPVRLVFGVAGLPLDTPVALEAVFEITE